jgi:hypothetical protein
MQAGPGQLGTLVEASLIVGRGVFHKAREGILYE